MCNKTHKLGFLASLGFGDWSVDAVCECLAGVGYSAVEWTLAHFNPTLPTAELIDLVKIPEKHHLIVSEIVAQQDFITLDEALFEQRVSFVEACIKAAANIGVNHINLFSGPAVWDPNAFRVGRDLSETKAWALLDQAFSRLLPIAEKHQVFLCVEAVFGQLVHEYYTLMELLRHFDSPNLAVNMDPSHYKLYGNDLVWVIENLAPYIRHVHLKDVIGKPGILGEDFTFPMLGEGTVDWAEFSNTLHTIHYEGVCSIEFESFNYYNKVMQGDPRKAAEISFTQAMKLIDSK